MDSHSHRNTKHTVLQLRYASQLHLIVTFVNRRRNSTHISRYRPREVFVNKACIGMAARASIVTTDRDKTKKVPDYSRVRF